MLSGTDQLREFHSNQFFEIAGRTQYLLRA